MHRQRGFKFPNNTHGTAALVTHIVDRPEVTEWHGNIIFFIVVSNKKQDCMAVFAMIDVALPGWRFFRGCALGLPVEKGFANGIIFVHGRRGKVMFRFI